jgi:hypothetical protein
MKFGYLILGIILFLLVVPMISSEKTVKTIELPFNYIASADKDTDHFTNIYLNPPDRISDILSSKIILEGDFQSNSIITGKLDLDGQHDCIPNAWTIDSSDRQRVVFDCSNFMNNYRGGNFSFGFSADKKIDNVVGDLKLTYYNNPITNVFSVGGTEYSATENARTVLHILDNEGQPLNNAICTIYVRNSNDEIVVNNQTLDYINGSNGLYGYTFATSLPYGVYSVDGACNFNGTFAYVADTFHVAPWTDALDNVGSGTKEAEIARVSGTEYQIGETAHILVQVLQNGVPDNTADCLIDVFRPNASFSDDLEQVVFSENMEYITDSNGIYVYNFNQTDFHGSYVADTVCSSSAIGTTPTNRSYNVTDSVSGGTMELIAEHIINTTNDNTGIVSLMSVEGEAVGGDLTGQYILEIDGNNYTFSRAFVDGEPGNLFIPHAIDAGPSGQHTIRAYHNTTANTLDSKVNIGTIALEDEFVQIPYCTASRTTDLIENKPPFEDMTDVECTIALTQSSKIFIALAFEAESSTAGKTTEYTVSIDGVDQESNFRYFGSPATPGALSFVTLSNDELLPGSHTIKGRWGALSGSITGRNFKLIVFAQEAGNRQLSFSEDTLALTTTDSQTIETIGVETTATLNNDNRIFSLLSLSAESGTSNREAHFSIRHGGDEGIDFARYFPVNNVPGSITVVEPTDILSTGFYNVQGRWFIDGPGNPVLTGENIKLISIGFSTTSGFAPLYKALDFRVINLTQRGEEFAGPVWSFENRTLTEFDFDVVNETEIAEAVWNFNGTILSGLLDQFAQSVWSYVNRTLTEFTFTVNTTTVINVTEIADNVWNYVERNLTTTEDVTDYNLIQALVWNATTRTLTEFNFTVDVDFDEIAMTVWEYNNRTLTEFNFTVNTNINLTDINGTAIAEEVWNYQGNVTTNILEQFADYLSCTLSELININDGWGIHIRDCSL